MCTSSPKQQPVAPPPPPPTPVAPLANPEDLNPVGPNAAAKGRRRLSISANAAPASSGLAV